MCGGIQETADGVGSSLEWLHTQWYDIFLAMPCESCNINGVDTEAIHQYLPESCVYSFTLMI